MDAHPVVTADYPENLSRGIMICGYNFGFSAADAEREEQGIMAAEQPSSFFSDSQVNDTLFRNRLVRWLNSWGPPLANDGKNVGAYERSFFQTNWLGTQTNTIADDGISIGKLVAESEGILSLIEVRKPRLIIFTGSQLIEALNDIKIREKVESILGPRPGNAQIHVSDARTTGSKFKLLEQQFPETAIVCIPHATGARGVSDEYMAGFRGIMQRLLLQG